MPRLFRIEYLNILFWMHVELYVSISRMCRPSIVWNHDLDRMSPIAWLYEQCGRNPLEIFPELREAVIAVRRATNVEGLMPAPTLGEPLVIRRRGRGSDRSGENDPSSRSRSRSPSRSPSCNRDRNPSSSPNPSPSRSRSPSSGRSVGRV